MSNTLNGGPANPPAFPRGADSVGADWRHLGLTLRDYFAAKAMGVFLTASPEARDHPRMAATWAYEMADAMLAEREQ